MVRISCDEIKSRRRIDGDHHTLVPVTHLFPRQPENPSCTLRTMLTTWFFSFTARSTKVAYGRFVPAHPTSSASYIGAFVIFKFLWKNLNSCLTLDRCQSISTRRDESGQKEKKPGKGVVLSSDSSSQTKEI